MMKDRPRNCHTEMRATAGNAQVGFSRMAGCGLMPSHGRSPTTGSMSVPKITARHRHRAHDGGGRRSSGRSAIPLISRWAARASSRPPSSPVGTTMITNNSVETRLWWNSVEPKTDPICLKPT